MVDIPGSEVTAGEVDSTGSFDAASRAGGGVYEVLEGDNLWKIAERHYNSGYKWVEIAEANKLSNPRLLTVGQRLEMPAVVDEAVGIPIGGGTVDGSSYQVIRGDNLWEIAVRS